MVPMLLVSMVIASCDSFRVESATGNTVPDIPEWSQLIAVLSQA